VELTSLLDDFAEHVNFWCIYEVGQGRFQNHANHRSLPGQTAWIGTGARKVVHSVISNAFSRGWSISKDVDPASSARFSLFFADADADILIHEVGYKIELYLLHDGGQVSNLT